MVKKKIDRCTDWSFIVYPESAPKGWRETLDDTHVRWLESPLHDKDLDPGANGTMETKKEHWHILMSFDGLKSLRQVEEITNSLNAPKPMRVQSTKGLVRYMIHLDNPEKHQYDIEEIVAHNGADVGSYFQPTATNRISIMKEVITYIYEHRIDNFADFMMLCIETSDDWFNVVINYNTMAINKMIIAMWHKNRRVESLENYSSE